MNPALFRLMPGTIRKVLLLALSYTGLAVAWGLRLHAGDAPVSQDNERLEATRVEVATRLASAPGHLQRAALFQLAMLPEAEVRALRQWLETDPEQRLRQLTVVQGPVHAPCPLNTALIFVELGRADAPPLDDSRLLISAAGDRLEEPHRLAALDLLARKASENNENVLALEIHQRICESPVATWQNVLDLAESARLARRPAAALKVVNAWLGGSRPRLTAAQHDDALDLQAALLLEGARHAEASRMVLDDLRSLKLDAPLPSRLLQRALFATRAAGESVELLPWIERHLRAFPEHKLAVEEVAAGKTVSADYLRWLRESATIADRQNHTSIACDDFFRLAAAGEIHVLARLHALATQIGRGRELAQLLTTLQRRFSVIEISRALADGNAPAPARALLAAHLQISPENRAGWRLLTEIDIIQRGKSSAPMLWEGFLKRFPDDVPALRQLARLQIQNSQFPQALRTLQQISDEHLDEATLRQTAAIAIRLDDLPAAHHAHKLLVRQSKPPAISDVITLAELTRQNPDAAAGSVLAETIVRLPAGSAFQKELLSSATTNGGADSFSTAVKTR